MEGLQIKGESYEYIFFLLLRDDDKGACKGKLYIDSTLVSPVRNLHKDDNDNKQSHDIDLYSELLRYLHTANTTRLKGNNRKREATGTKGLDLLQGDQYVSGDRWQGYRVDAGVPGVDGIPGARGN